MKALQELLTQIAEKDNQVAAIWDEVDAKHNGTPTPDHLERVKSLNQEIADLDKRASDLKDAADLRAATSRAAEERRRQLDDVVTRIPQPNGKASRDGQASPGGAASPAALAVKTVGQAFVDSPEFRDWLKAVAPAGVINEKMRVQSPSFGFQFKDLVTGVSATSGGAIIVSDNRPLVELPMRPLTIRDVITNGQTGSDLIEYPRVTGYTNNAAPVAEATATAGSSGVKPESALALERVSTAVKTIAHWIPATKRALADAGQIRTLIDNFLRYGLEEELEDQIINGSGAGENFTGISNTTGISSQAYDTNLLTTTRKARTVARVTGRARPNAYLMHPNDWEDVDLLQDNEARYYYGGPREMGTPRLWGLPVVESEALTEGTAYVGDFRQVVLWDREQANIQVTDSHADFFIRNLVAILAEMRAALGIFRPAAIVEIDLTA